MNPAGIFNSTSVPVLEQVVNYAEARHNVLAGNIANIDTPGYRTRDISPERFQDRLKEAIRQRDEGRTGGASGSPHYGASMRKVSDDLKSILYHDQTNVSIEHQIAEISKNQQMHNMALHIMANQFQLLEAAISERA